MGPLYINSQVILVVTKVFLGHVICGENVVIIINSANCGCNTSYKKTGEKTGFGVRSYGRVALTPAAPRSANGPASECRCSRAR
jgi:hypothetical protein